jgi:hypothetical protein
MTTQHVTDQGPFSSLEQAIDADCRAYRGGHTAVCATLNQPYAAFQKRLSSAYPDHHLHADDVARVVELTRGPAVRDWFEQVYGVISYQPVPVPELSDALKAMADKCSMEAQFFASLRDGIADNVWRPHEVARLQAHANDLIRQIKGIVLGARNAMVEEDEVHG